MQHSRQQRTEDEGEGEEDTAKRPINRRDEKEDCMKQERGEEERGRSQCPFDSERGGMEEDEEEGDEEEGEEEESGEETGEEEEEDCEERSEKLKES